MKTKTPHERIAKGWHLTLEEVEAAGGELLQPATVASRYGIETPGTKLWYHDLDGNLIRHSRTRLFDTSQGKYRTSGDQPHIYLPKRLIRKLRKAAKNTGVAIYCVEGEAKAVYAALHCDFLCIAIPGVANWQAGGAVATELDQFDWQGREVVLVPDSDWQSNAEVRRWFSKLGAELERRGAVVSVKLLTTRKVDLENPLKSKTGIDDYMAETEDFGLEEIDAVSFDVARGWQKDIDTLPIPLLNAQPYPANFLGLTLPEPECVLCPYLNREEVMMWAGPGGISKTYVLMYGATAVASGRDVLHFLPDNPEGAKVLYVMAERTKASLDRRMQRVFADVLSLSTGKMSFIGDTDEERKADRETVKKRMLKNIVTAPLAGTRLRLIRFRNQEWSELTQNIDDLIGLIRRHNAAFVILDPLSRLYGGQDSNELAQVMTNVFERIASEANCCICAVAHTGKSLSQQSGDSQYSVRGASAWVDNASSAATLAEEDPGKVRTADGTPLQLEPGETLLLMRHKKRSDGPKADDEYLIRGTDGLLRLAAAEAVSIYEQAEPHMPAFRAWAKRQTFTFNQFYTAWAAPSPLKLKKQAATTLFGELLAHKVIRLATGATQKRTSGALYELAESSTPTAPTAPTTKSRKKRVRQKPR